MVNPRKKTKFKVLGARSKRVRKRWKKPRGIHSKLRRHEKSKGSRPSPSYGAPKALRYLHPSGFKEVLVSNLKDLEKIDPKTEAARISHKVGKKKRVQLVKRAEEKKIKVLNP